MQKTKISTKFSQIILYISLFVLSIASLVAFYIMGNIESSTQNMIKNSINIKLENKINNSFSIGVTNAVAIAENKNIKDALKNMDKEKAYEILNNLVNEYAKFSDHKNAKIHIHTKDVKSFLRSWVKDHNGDELSSFRHTINKVKMTHKEVLDIEVGWANLVIRAIVPIMDDKEYLGSLEFIQDFNYIRERLESENKYLLSLIDKKLLKNQPDRNNVIGKYALVQERFNKDFFKVLKEVNFDKLIKNGYINKDGKYFSIKPIIGFNDSFIGYYIVGQDYKEVQKILLESQNITISFIILMILMALVIAIALNITVKELIVKNLSSVTDGLGSFFKFLNKESDDFKKIDIEVNDEIGQMANEINTNIKVIEDLLDNEKQENWIQNGLLGLRSSLSGEINIDLVSNKAIAYLCEYLKGGVGVLYVYRESLSELELSASYAYTRDKNESSKVKLGEGVIGQVALQKTPIILTDIDTSNITITTSFTDTKNLNIYTYPLIYQDNLLGVVEIGTQKLFNKNELRFFELCDEIVATSLYTSIQNKKVVNLLDDSEKSNQTLKEKQSLLEHANSQMQEQQAQLEEVNSQM
ncbi:MAG: cache domain-containing protein, partial [Campylobacterota bacterium]|nr:cache domain-containing protein [Campylobacterota bacterium]